MNNQEFETLLKQYCPDIYKLFQLRKFDQKYQVLIDSIVSIVDENKFSVLEIHYQSGKINHIFEKENKTAKTSL